MITVTYRNDANGETKTLAMDPTTSSSVYWSESYEVAWGAGLRTICRLTGWSRFDVVPIKMSASRADSVIEELQDELGEDDDEPDDDMRYVYEGTVELRAHMRGACLLDIRDTTPDQSGLQHMPELLSWFHHACGIDSYDRPRYPRVRIEVTVLDPGLGKEAC